MKEYKIKVKEKIVVMIVIKTLVIVVVWQMIMMLVSTSVASISPVAVRMAKPGCQDRCGDVLVPYPFGIGSGCYHDPGFEILCLDGHLYLIHLPNYVGPYGGQQILQLPWEEERQILSIPTPIENLFPFIPAFNNGSSDSYTPFLSNVHDLEGSPYLFSSKENILLVSGCAGAATMVDRKNKTLAGCASICIDKFTTAVTECLGVGCCQAAPISAPFDYYNFNFSVLGMDFSLNWAMFVDKNWIINNNTTDYRYTNPSDVGAQVVLEWTIKDLPINDSTYANSTCTLKNDNGGLVCRCKQQFYQGNPYLPYGCQVVKECESCVQECTLLSNNSFGCPIKGKGKQSTLLLVVGISLGIGSMLALLGAYWIYHVIKRRRNLELKTKNFERNGGLLLKQKMSSTDQNSSTANIKIFNSEELDKATDQYNQDRILGQGGQGMVYKGMLSDGKIVAIKKSKIVDESQLKVFINEVVILSQINHRNVVKLLGCCLETEVPMLVYEYVPNGTLSENIHASKKEFPITWELRLHIATDIANALAYLHSSYLIPILHRDIKSSNILLDTKYRAKLSDFGVSMSLEVDQTHITTRVIGTFGYLDPEYFYSRQFTDKSDVYSFGVVLVELLSGQEATNATEVDQRGLVAWFIEHMNESNLYDILDARVIREGREEDIIAVANLAKRCTNLDGKRRPTMKEVTAELETVRSSQQPELTRNQSLSSSNELGELPLSQSSIDITMEDD